MSYGSNLLSDVSQSLKSEAWNKTTNRFALHCSGSSIVAAVPISLVPLSMGNPLSSGTGVFHKSRESGIRRPGNPAERLRRGYHNITHLRTRTASGDDDSGENSFFRPLPAGWRA